MLELRLLGQFEVRLDGLPVSIPSRPAQSLLAYLGLKAIVRSSASTHKAGVFATAFSPDGRQLASIDQDGVARIWDATTGEERLALATDTRGNYSSRYAQRSKSITRSQATSLRMSMPIFSRVFRATLPSRPVSPAPGQAVALPAGKAHEQILRIRAALA